MQDENTPKFIDATQNAYTPPLDKTKKAVSAKMIECQNTVATVDKLIAVLPAMKMFVKNKLVEAEKSVTFGTKISNGGLGDWISVDENLQKASDQKSGLKALNEHAKNALSNFVKEARKLGFYPLDRAYFEGEKLIYLADREFADLNRMIAQTEKDFAWLKRRKMIDVPPEDENVTPPKRK